MIKLSVIVPVYNCEQYISKCLDSLVNQSLKDIDLVIIDPPRSGLDKKTLSYLLNEEVNRIVYVSCNPITLARDINILKELYTIEAITLFDMFPNTYHVESVVSLKLK